MIRVTKPGGQVFFIIPTYIQSLCAFVHLYLYIMKRIFEVVIVKVFRMQPKKDNTLLPRLNDSSRQASGILRSFFKNQPSFPLPMPHGSYKNIFQEFNQQFPRKWTELARRCGAESINSFAILYFPFNILEVFSTRLIAWLYHKTRWLHYILGRSFLKYFSYGLCVVARKPRETN